MKKFVVVVFVLMSPHLWGQMALNIEQGVNLESYKPNTTIGVTFPYVNISYSTNNEVGVGIFINPWENKCRQHRSNLIVGTGVMATDKDINLYVSAGYYHKGFGVYLKQSGFENLSIGIMLNPFKLFKTSRKSKF